MPEWYTTIKVAQFYGISPEVAMDLPTYWKDRTLMAISAEAEAQEILSRQG